MGVDHFVGEQHHFIRRILDLIRREGIPGFLSRLKKELSSGIHIRDGYVFVLDYAEATPPSPVENIDVAELIHPSPLDCESIAKYHFHANTSDDVLRYLEEGQRCFVARCEDKIVSWFWVDSKNFYDYHLHRNIMLSDNEDYYLGGYTVPEFRGKAVFKYLILEALQGILKKSPDAHHRAVAFVDVNNQPSIKACQKMGFKVIGHIGYLGIFGVRLNYIFGRDVLPRTRPRFILSR